MIAMFAAGICPAIWAATPDSAAAERPQEINKTYEIKPRDMKNFGAEVNADVSHLDRLFGTASDWDTLQISLPKTAEKGWLGIAIKPPAQPPKEPGTDNVLQAIEVTGVMPDSGAEAAGLREGDLIVGLAGQPIEDKGDKTLLALRTAVAKVNLGEKLKLRILRGETILELEAIVASRPRVDAILKPHPDLEKKSPGDATSLLGDALAKEKLTDELARLLKEFRNETDKVVSPLVRRENYNPFRLQEVNYVLYNPLQLPKVGRNITDRLHGSLDKTHHDLAALLGTAMDELDMAYVPAKLSGNKPPANLAEYIERLLNAIQHAKAERTAALSALDASEIEFLYTTAETFFEGESDTAAQEPSEEEKKKIAADKKEDEARLLRFLKLVLKLDMPRLLNASAEVAQAIDPDTLAALTKNSGKLTRYPKGRILHQDKNLTVIDTPAAA